MPDGILMPTVEVFFEATAEALSLMPQAGDHYYLAGKGWGTEIALQGNVVGRKKLLADIPARSHSDFELYGTQKGFQYTEAFYARFGAQEFYPQSKTKGLSDLPEGLLVSTAECAVLPMARGPLEILLPQLELLFLDKWLKQETTPRVINERAACDAECLAAAYELDRGLLHHYLDQYVIEPERKRITESRARCSGNQTKNVAKVLTKLQRQSIDEGGKTLSYEELAATLNTQMHAFSKAIYCGVAGSVYEPISATDIACDNGAIAVSNQYDARAQKRIQSIHDGKLADAEILHEQLDEILLTAKALRRQLTQSPRNAPAAVTASHFAK